MDSIEAALVGGALIGVATGAMWLGLGRIAGISGTLGAALTPREPGQRGWRFAFLAGLLGGAAAIAVAQPTAFAPSPASVGVLAVAGLLVGFGTRLGHGCTSGHGVCGNARLSPRSFAATATFIALGMLTVGLVRSLG